MSDTSITCIATKSLMEETIARGENKTLVNDDPNNKLHTSPSVADDEDLRIVNDGGNSDLLMSASVAHDEDLRIVNDGGNSDLLMSASVAHDEDLRIVNDGGNSNILMSASGAHDEDLRIVNNGGNSDLLMSASGAHDEDLRIVNDGGNSDLLMSASVAHDEDLRFVNDGGNSNLMISASVAQDQDSTQNDDANENPNFTSKSMLQASPKTNDQFQCESTIKTLCTDESLPSEKHDVSTNEGGYYMVPDFVTQPKKSKKRKRDADDNDPDYDDKGPNTKVPPKKKRKTKRIFKKLDMNESANSNAMVNKEEQTTEQNNHIPTTSTVRYRKKPGPKPKGAINNGESGTSWIIYRNKPGPKPKGGIPNASQPSNKTKLVSTPNGKVNREEADASTVRYRKKPGPKPKGEVNNGESGTSWIIYRNKPGPKPKEDIPNALQPSNKTKLVSTPKRKINSEEADASTVRHRKKPGPKPKGEVKIVEGDATAVRYRKKVGQKLKEKVKTVESVKTKCSRTDERICSICNEVQLLSTYFWHITEYHNLPWDTYLETVVSKRSEIECNCCGIIVSSKKALRFHKNALHKLHKHKCRLCLQFVANGASLTLHLQKNHKLTLDKYLREQIGINTSDIVPTRKYSYSCEICPTGFDSAKEYISHVKLHENDDNLEDNVEKIVVYKNTQVIKKISYTDLKLVFSDEEKLVPVHQLNPVPRILRITEHQCSLCNSYLKNRTELNDHIRNLHKLQFHLCKLCNARTKNALALKKHLFKDHKGVRVSEYLEEHLNTSLAKIIPEKFPSFACSQCNRVFLNPDTCISHCNKQHNMQLKPEDFPGTVLLHSKM